VGVSLDRVEKFVVVVIGPEIAVLTKLLVLAHDDTS